MNIFETLKNLSPEPKRKEPCYIFRDEQSGQIKEVPLSKSDSAGALINSNRKPRKKINEAKLIHDSIFGKP